MLMVIIKQVNLNTVLDMNTGKDKGKFTSKVSSEYGRLVGLKTLVPTLLFLYCQKVSFRYDRPSPDDHTIYRNIMNCDCENGKIST